MGSSTSALWGRLAFSAHQLADSLEAADEAIERTHVAKKKKDNSRRLKRFRDDYDDDEENEENADGDAMAMSEDDNEVAPVRTAAGQEPNWPATYEESDGE